MVSDSQQEGGGHIQLYCITGVRSWARVRQVDPQRSQPALAVGPRVAPKTRVGVARHAWASD